MKPAGISQRAYSDLVRFAEDRGPFSDLVRAALRYMNSGMAPGDACAVVLLGVLAELRKEVAKAPRVAG